MEYGAVRNAETSVSMPSPPLVLIFVLRVLTCAYSFFFDVACTKRTRYVPQGMGVADGASAREARRGNWCRGSEL